jgi:hypothetical protein
MSDTTTECTLGRTKDGKLTILSAPEIFLCTRRSIQDLIDQHNEHLDEAHSANLRTEQAKRERDAVATDLDQLRTDIRALLTETDLQREAHDIDRHVAFTRRKIAFFDKHEELLKPRHSHEDTPGDAAAP